MVVNIADTKTNINSSTPSVLQEGLRALRFRHIYGLISVAAMYLLIKWVGISEWKTGPAFIVGTLIGTICVVLFKDKKTIYIYGYQLENDVLELFLVNIFGKKESLVIPVSRIEKVKYRKGNYRTKWDRIWFHLDTEIRELYFFKKGMGNGLIQHLNVEKL